MGKLTHTIPRVLCTTLALLLLLLSGAVALPALAAPANKFTVKANIPDNQVDSKLTYFDLRVEPGMRQTLQVSIQNSESQDILANITVNAASTGRNGLIIYSEEDIRDASMSHSIADMVTLPQDQVMIPAGKSTEVDIHLNIPDEPFEGVVLGGITVTAEAAKAGLETDAQAVQLQNETAYVIGLKLSMEDSEIAPDFHLDSVEVGLVNYHTAIIAQLQNPVPRIVKNMQVRAEVMRENDQEPLRTLEIESADMAPSSTGSFVIDWGGPVSSGSYLLNMRAEYEGELWEWSHPFQVGNQDAQDVNNGAVGLTISQGPSWLWWLLLLLAVALLIYVFYRIRQQRRLRHTS